jgi:hypothetical protein
MLKGDNEHDNDVISCTFVLVLTFMMKQVLLFSVCIYFAMPDVDVKANKKAGGLGDGIRLASGAIHIYWN